MKKLLMCMILAMAVAVLLSASPVSAVPGIGVEIQPQTHYTAPGKMVEYTITVHNYDSVDKSVALEIEVGKCKIGWFEWTKIHVVVQANSVKSVSIKITPGSDAIGGPYNWGVIAATTDESASARATVVVQDYDYVCETYVEGEGVFTIDKKVRSSTVRDTEQQRFAVNVEKHFECRGSIDGFVLDEYLIDGARGNNPNFKQVSAVDNYAATLPGDYLYGDEKLRSSFVFGGTGAKIHETYDVQKMDARLESINLHSTGDQRYKTELETINEFQTGPCPPGIFMIDARQSVPGAKHIEEREVFCGNWTVSKHLIFRRPEIPTFDP